MEFTLKKVHLSLPRFDVDYKIEEMKPLFNKWGVHKAFTLEAEFDKMSRYPVGVAKIVHQANITLAEKGTEAAAATVTDLTLGVSMYIKEKEKPMIFTADRPFIFMINDGLFIGAYTTGKEIAEVKTDF